MSEDAEQQDAGTAGDAAVGDAAAADAAAAGEAAGDAAAGYTPEAMDDSVPPASPAEVNLDLVLAVPVDVTLEVGRTSISIRDLVNLVEGSIVALDRDATDPMDVLVNGTLVARGEIVVVNEQYGVRLTDIVSPAERVAGLN